MNLKSNVTVIIPCYNDGLYIMQALHSILNQTLKAENVIIVDDGSDEETKKVLERIKYDKVTIIHQDNQGVSKARNNAIKLAQTDYILNLDADDYWEPTFIEKAVELLNLDSEIAAVGCWIQTLKNNVVQKEIKKPIGGYVKNFIVKNNASASSLFRKKCWEEVGGYDEQMINGYEDWEFWISILRRNWRIEILQEVLYTYRIKRESRDQKALKKYDFSLKKYVFLKHIDLYTEHFEFYATELLRQNSVFRNNENKAKKTLDFRIGSLILSPVRLLKRIVKK